MGSAVGTQRSGCASVLDREHPLPAGWGVFGWTAAFLSVRCRAWSASERSGVAVCGNVAGGCGFVEAVLVRVPRGLRHFNLAVWRKDPATTAAGTAALLNLATEPLTAISRIVIS